MTEQIIEAVSLQSDNDDMQVLGFEQEVLCELVRLHAGMLTRLPWVQTLLVVGVGLLIHRVVPPAWLIGWGLMTIGGECIRAHHARQLLQQARLESPTSAHRLLILLAAVVGATVGLSAVLFLPHMPLPDQALLMIILFAMPAAGVSVAVSSRQILAAYSLLILAPAAASWAWLYPGQLFTVAGLTALYWGFILMVAGDGEHLLRRAVAIRRERDLTLRDLEQRNAEVRVAVVKAEQSSRARSRVLAAASHDLRQPLHALSVYSAVLVANPSAETLPEVARNIDRLVRNLGGLLHGLLDLSRLSADQYHPELQRISLDRLVAEVCNEYEPQAQDKQLRLVRKLGYVRLHDDAVAIGRIIRNLLDNAIKYTERGEVTVTTCRADDKAMVIIEDTGRGIPDDEQQKIFEEFYQLENPGRDQAAGVGLGLSIVQRLCELINAEIDLSSKFGTGTRFQVSFTSLSIEAASRPSQDEETSVCLQGKRVYILDDEKDILQAMRLLLFAWHIQVNSAVSAEQVQILFDRQGKPDLLIVDLRLGEMRHGVEIASHLQEVYGDFPVLVVTGETAMEAMQLSNHKGFPLLQKPIVADTLYAAVCSALAG